MQRTKNTIELPRVAAVADLDVIEEISGARRRALAFLNGKLVKATGHIRSQTVNVKPITLKDSITLWAALCESNPQKWPDGTWDDTARAKWLRMIARCS